VSFIGIVIILDVKHKQICVLPNLTDCHSILPSFNACHSVLPNLTDCHSVLPNLSACHSVNIVP